MPRVSTKCWLAEQIKTAIPFARINVNHKDVTNPELFTYCAMLATVVSKHRHNNFDFYSTYTKCRLLFFFSPLVVDSSAGGCDSSFWASVGDSALSDIFSQLPLLGWRNGLHPPKVERRFATNSGYYWLTLAKNDGYYWLRLASNTDYYWLVQRRFLTRNWTTVNA